LARLGPQFSPGDPPERKKEKCLMAANRRLSVRFPAQFPALIKYSTQPGGTQVIEMRTTNISTRGVLLDTQMHLPLRKKVDVDIIVQPVLPGSVCDDSCDDFISISGRIVRRDFSGLAISFDLEYKVFSVRERIRILRRQLDWIVRNHGGFTADRLTVV
jgi:hypothetical protein